jgi:hypothetical protein
MGVIGVIDVTGVDRSLHDRAPQVLVPFDKKEAIPLKEAAARAGRSEGTIKNWCRAGSDSALSHTLPALPEGCSLRCWC